VGVLRLEKSTYPTAAAWNLSFIATARQTEIDNPEMTLIINQ
jgi:hypothetical protein